MKSGSGSFAGAEPQSEPQNGSTLSTIFDQHLLATALWVFAGYYLGCKIGFALTFKPHPVSVLWPPNSVLVAALLLTPTRKWWLVLSVALLAHLAGVLWIHVCPLL